MSPVVSLKGWEKRNAMATKRGYYTEHDSKLASSWETCAIGEKHKVLYNTTCDYDGEGLTAKAENLGVDFMYAVAAGRKYSEQQAINVARACAIFTKIKQLDKVNKAKYNASMRY